MATIIPRTTKDGITSYFVRVRWKGAPPQSATFSTRSDAKKWALMIEGTVIDGRHFPTLTAKRHTVEDMLNRYRQDVLPHKRHSTTRDQVRQLQWWKGRIGHHTLADITPAHIVTCRDILTRGNRSNATVNRYLAALSHAFTMAVREWQWCPDNPVRKVTRPKEPRGRVRFLVIHSVIPRFLPRRILTMHGPFPLETAKKPFGHRIIEAVTLPTHTTAYARVCEEPLIRLPGILTSPIRVVQQPAARLPPSQRHLPCPLH